MQRFVTLEIDVANRPFGMGGCRENCLASGVGVGCSMIIHCNDNDHDNANKKSVLNVCRSKLSLGAPGQEEK